MGDAVHWEALLNASNAYWLDLVSRDSDYSSELSPDTLRSFLTDEWKARKDGIGRIKLFRSLSDYFRAKYPPIKLTHEAEKNGLIAQLASSPNFSTTHATVAKLKTFSFYTNAQVEKLFSALVENNQVGWIAEDDEIKDFYLTLKD